MHRIIHVTPPRGHVIIDRWHFTKELTVSRFQVLCNEVLKVHSKLTVSRFQVICNEVMKVHSSVY